jgi:hypothetical protein
LPGAKTRMNVIGKPDFGQPRRWILILTFTFVPYQK